MEEYFKPSKISTATSQRIFEGISSSLFGNKIPGGTSDRISERILKKKTLKGVEGAEGRFPKRMLDDVCEDVPENVS